MPSTTTFGLALGFVAASAVSAIALVDAARTAAQVEAAVINVKVSAVPIARERPGTTDLYFIGGAGWAQQDVFLSEATSARALFDSRFDTAGRSIVLSNDPAAGGMYPAFTHDTLRDSLGRVGHAMNPHEDVLFLYLTSHGSQRGLAVDNEVLEPAELRRMLDGAGIMWRVIVIAGCETGVFIDALKTETTLIATAASDSRPSYGCESGRAYTEFGRALLAEELPQATNFGAALREAARDVTRNEAAADILPSEPQIAEGPAIAAKLATTPFQISPLQAGR